MKISTQKSVNNLEHRINVTMMYSSFTALTEALSNASSYIGNLKHNGIADSYIKSSILVSLTENVFPSIKKEFENNKSKRLQVTKEISYVVGLFNSIIISVGNCGSGYFLTLGLNLCKNTASTMIIDKLNNLGQVDGVSVAILIGFLFDMPKIILSSLSKPFIETILTIISLVSLFGINYTLLKSGKEIPVQYRGTEGDNISLGISSVYSQSIYASSILMTILTKFNVALSTSYSLTFLLIPIACYILTNENNTADKITKYLNKSGGTIPSIRPGKETKEFIKKNLNSVNLKYGIIGSFIFIASHLIITYFGIPTSPMYVAMIINSSIRVSYSIKAMKTINKTKRGFLS